MDEIKFNAQSIAEMKSFYQEELGKALKRLEHINEVLTQLGAKDLQVDISYSGSRPAKSNISVAKRKYKKKRGPKSKWDKVILKAITAAGRPLSYDEITDYLMISEGREPSLRKNTKATVQNTVFRLRRDKKLGTFSMGARTKYIAPKTWFGPNGEIEEEFRSKVTVPKKKNKPVIDGPRRGPGRPRKIISENAPAQAIPSKSKTTPKKKVVSRPKATKVKAKAAAPSKEKREPVKKKNSTKTKSSIKKNAPKKQASVKSTPKSKSPVKKSTSAKKSTASKKASTQKIKNLTTSKTPRKLAMTKTVRAKRKKKK